LVAIVRSSYKCKCFAILIAILPHIYHLHHLQTRVAALVKRLDDAERHNHELDSRIRHLEVRFDQRKTSYEVARAATISSYFTQTNRLRRMPGAPLKGRSSHPKLERQFSQSSPS
jgi:hypothetical protein